MEQVFKIDKIPGNSEDKISEYKGKQRIFINIGKNREEAIKIINKKVSISQGKQPLSQLKNPERYLHSDGNYYYIRTSYVINEEHINDEFELEEIRAFIDKFKDSF